MSATAAAEAVLRAAEAATGLRGHVVAGEAALDSCCGDNGWALVVSIEGFAPVGGFPAPWGAQNGNTSNPPQLALQMHVLVAHCVPTLNDDGSAPDKKVEQAEHMELTERSAQVWRAMARLAPDAVVGEASPFQVTGGCGWIDVPVLVDSDEWC